MLKHIIVVAPRGQQLGLCTLLRHYNPALSFVSINTVKALDLIPANILARSRLVAFTTDVIVPEAILKTLGYGAYNFHPGPPEYPGWAPAHFAHYEGAKLFGATAHVMTKYVDDGPIVGVERFIVPPGVALRMLEQIAFVRLAHLFWRLAESLATSQEPLQILPVQWGKNKSTKRSYAAMCDIPPDLSQDELVRRLNAFTDDFRKMRPAVTLHGIRFEVTAAMVENAAVPAAAPEASRDVGGDVRKRA